MSRQPGTAINTRSGRVLDFAQPDPSAIHIDDIAGGLSLAPRFGGQALQFHSVAQHAVNVCLVVGAVLNRPDLDLEALHHDSHEAYSCDLPKPLKRLLPEYSDITDRLDVAIATAFGFNLPGPESDAAKAIKIADNAVFVIEAEVLLPEQAPHPEIDPEVLRAARSVVGYNEHWDHRGAAERFKLAHAGCLRHR